MNNQDENIDIEIVENIPVTLEGFDEFSGNQDEKKSSKDNGEPTRKSRFSINPEIIVTKITAFAEKKKQERCGENLNEELKGLFEECGIEVGTDLLSEINIEKAGKVAAYVGLACGGLGLAVEALGAENIPYIKNFAPQKEEKEDD